MQGPLPLLSKLREEKKAHAQIDPAEGSQHITIRNCTIVNGDDCVAVKPGPAATGCTSDILVEDCHFSQGMGAVIGSMGANAGCIRDVTFRRITIDSTAYGLRIKSWNGTSDWSTSFLRNVTFEGVTLRNTGPSPPIVVNQ